MLKGSVLLENWLIFTYPTAFSRHPRARIYYLWFRGPPPPAFLGHLALSFEPFSRPRQPQGFHHHPLSWAWASNRHFWLCTPSSLLDCHSLPFCNLRSLASLGSHLCSRSPSLNRSLWLVPVTPRHYSHFSRHCWCWHLRTACPVPVSLLIDCT